MRTLFAFLATAIVLVAIDRLAATDALVGTPVMALSWAAEALMFFLPAVAVLLALVLIVPAARNRLAAAGGLVLVVAAAMLWSTPSPSTAEAGHPRDLRVVSVNVMSAQGDFDRLRRWLATVRPDVVVLQEVVFDWGHAMDGWSEFPYRLRGRDGDVEILSRLPLDMDGGDPVAVLDPSTVRAVFKAPDGRPLVVWGVHPPSPHTPDEWVARNRHLADLAARVAAEQPGARVIVAGDWNTASWSPRLRRFLADTGLSIAHEGPIPRTTRFLLQIGAPTFVGAPVDHIAVSPTVDVVGQTLGPPIGSDHLPVILDLKLPRPS